MKYLFVIAINLCFIANSNADYIKGALGANIDSEATFTSAGTSTTEELKTMILFPVVFAYGYELMENLSLEGELSLQTANYKTPGLSNSASTNNFAINAVGSLPVDAIGIYIGIGAAYGMYRMGGGSEKTGYGIGAQSFVGVDYALDSGTRLGLEYRYFQSVQDIDIGGGIDAEYKSHSALATAKFPL
jgi:opacity protein-like surface antigen